MSYTNSYSCLNKHLSSPPPAGITDLGITYAIKSDTWDSSACNSLATNTACTYQQESCVDGPSTKNINGLDVYRDCWKYKVDYSCVTGNYVNYCSPLEVTQGCSLTSTTCDQTASNGDCLMQTKTFRCDNSQAQPLPTNVTYLDTSYTVVGDQLNSSACDQYSSNPNCTLASSTCTEGPATRVINGLSVYKDCWAWRKDYVCATTSLNNQCAEYANDPACTLQESSCIDTLPSGACGLLEHTYKCVTQQGTQSQVTNCGAQMYCIDGKCFETGYTPDQDFKSAISGMEVMRQATTYMDPNSWTMFRGDRSECSRGFVGLGNCCKSSSGSGNMTNSAFISGAMKVGSEAVQFLGSTYMYDALFMSDLVPTALLNSLYAGTGSSWALGGSDLSFYGVTFTWTAEAGLSLGFDPTSFAISLAITIIQQLMTCNDEEMTLAMRRGQGLCVKTRSWCADKVLGVCLQKKEAYCCYNSKLSKAIGVGANKQLGRSLVYECPGLAIEDIEKVDFSKIDFSEFIGTIQQKAKAATFANTRAMEKINSYYAQ